MFNTVNINLLEYQILLVLDNINVFSSVQFSCSVLSDSFVSFTQHQLGCLKGWGLCHLKVYSVIFLAVQLAVCWGLSCDSQLKFPPVASLCGLGQFKESQIASHSPTSKYHHIGGQVSLYRFWRDTSIQSTTYPFFNDIKVIYPK